MIHEVIHEMIHEFTKSNLGYLRPAVLRTGKSVKRWSKKTVKKVVIEKVQKVVIEVVKEQKRSLNLSRQIRVSQENS